MRAEVTVTALPLWRMRLRRELPRFALYAVALWGVTASARFAIAPPAPRIFRAPAVEEPDRAAESYAALFARHYLSWDAARPGAYGESLAPLLGEGLSEAAGVELPAAGSQAVQWAEVVESRRGPAGERVYTVACQTTGAGLLYLSVGVARDSSGALAIDGYPAFVGAPQSSSARDVAEGLQDVADPALETVVSRALRNYLAGQGAELAADLTATADVSLPAMALGLDTLERLVWVPGRGSVVALVQASDARGARYTLEYELDVTELDGRWEVAAIQMDPAT